MRIIATMLSATAVAIALSGCAYDRGYYGNDRYGYRDGYRYNNDRSYYDRDRDHDRYDRDRDGYRD